MIPGTLLATNANVLYSVTELSVDQRLTYGSSTLIMQGDCNLVLYTNSIPVWHTNTAVGYERCHAWLDSNGELLVYGRDRRGLPHTLWRSGVKSSQGYYVLVLGYDGTLNVYGSALWSNSLPITYYVLKATMFSKQPPPQYSPPPHYGQPPPQHGQAPRKGKPPPPHGHQHPPHKQPSPPHRQPPSPPIGPPSPCPPNYAPPPQHGQAPRHQQPPPRH